MGRRESPIPHLSELDNFRAGEGVAPRSSGKRVQAERWGLGKAK